MRINSYKKIIFCLFLCVLFCPIILQTTATFSISDESTDLLTELSSVENMNSLENSGSIDRSLESSMLEVESIDNMNQDKYFELENSSDIEPNQEGIMKGTEDDKHNSKLSDEGVIYHFEGVDGNSTAIVASYSGSDTEIEIPSEVINTNESWIIPSRVVAVAENAFTYSDITDIVLPETLITIGSASFLGSKLNQIVIPNSVTTIGNSAFSSSTSLAKITFGEGLESIGMFAFSNTNLINRIVMPENLKQIGNNAFMNARLQSVELNTKLHSIGNSAFATNKLSTLIIPDSVQEVGTGAFFQNELTEVHIGAGMTAINQTIFAENQLVELVIPENITSIGLSALRDNRFENIVIPKSVKSLAATVFLNCIFLEKITFMGDVDSLGMNIFNNNPLKSIVVPEDYVENYKSLLSANVMSLVTEQTKLSVEYPVYSLDTSFENNIKEGDAIQFKVIPNNKYYLSDLETLVWIENTPIIEWFKDGIKLANENSAAFTISEAKETDNGAYHAVVDGTMLGNITVMVSPFIDPSIPPVEPEGEIPDVVESQFEEALSIRFVSGLDFGEAEFKNNRQELFSLPTKNSNGDDIPTMVTVQDMRPENRRDGWQLMVRQNKEFLDGAQISMNPYAHEDFVERLNLKLLGSTLFLNDQDQFFAGAYPGNPSGIVSLSMDYPNGKGVQLNLPSGVGIGKHTTSLEWSLITGP